MSGYWKILRKIAIPLGIVGSLVIWSTISKGLNGTESIGPAIVLTALLGSIWWSFGKFIKHHQGIPITGREILIMVTLGVLFSFLLSLFLKRAMTRVLENPNLLLPGSFRDKPYSGKPLN